MDLMLWNICAFYRENEEPNQHTANTLLKEIKKVDQIKMMQSVQRGEFWVSLINNVFILLCIVFLTHIYVLFATVVRNCARIVGGSS